VAAQHSLPSGRYSLLGPDFHRLDRTSLRLAHSFDHLVGERQQHRRHVKAESLRSLEAADALELADTATSQPISSLPVTSRPIVVI
jgi:galactokinase